jgi:hypothetical protein
MYEWYIGPVGFEFVQFVGRHENLTNDLIRVTTLLGHFFDPEILRRFDPVNVSLKSCRELSVRRDRHSTTGPKTSLESFARRVFIRSGAKSAACTTTR